MNISTWSSKQVSNEDYWLICDVSWVIEKTTVKLIYKLKKMSKFFQLNFSAWEWDHLKEMTSRRRTEVFADESRMSVQQENAKNFLLNLQNQTMFMRRRINWSVVLGTNIGWFVCCFSAASPSFIVSLSSNDRRWIFIVFNSATKWIKIFLLWYFILCEVIAFLSAWNDNPGLIGSEGLLPAHESLERVSPFEIQNSLSFYYCSRHICRILFGLEWLTIHLNTQYIVECNNNVNILSVLWQTVSVASEWIMVNERGASPCSNSALVVTRWTVGRSHLELSLFCGVDNFIHYHVDWRFECFCSSCPLDLLHINRERWE